MQKSKKESSIILQDSCDNVELSVGNGYDNQHNGYKMLVFSGINAHHMTILTFKGFEAMRKAIRKYTLLEVDGQIELKISNAIIRFATIADMHKVIFQLRDFRRFTD